MARPEYILPQQTRQEVIDLFKLGLNRQNIKKQTGISFYHIKHILSEYHNYRQEKMKMRLMNAKKHAPKPPKVTDHTTESTDDDSLGDLSELSDSAVSSASASDSDQKKSS